MTKNKKNEGQLMKYTCKWPGCGFSFTQQVFKWYRDTAYGYEAKGKGSSKVICPRCKRGLRTWEDGEEV